MEVLKTAILEMCRQKKNNIFSPSDVAKWLFPEDWEQFMEDVRTVALVMNQDGLILVLQNGKPLESNSFPIGPIMISKIPNQNRDGAVLK